MTTINDLNQELFGSSDSDSDLDSQHDSQPQDSVDMGNELDPIFENIMNSHEETFDRMDTDESILQYQSSGGSIDSVIAGAQNNTDHLLDTPLFPNHLPHEHVPGLCLHTNVLSDKDQARLMAQITERNFFKAGQQNQAMCFGQRDLAWLDWLIHQRLIADENNLGRGILKEPYCSSSWTERIPLFDQSIMNLYFPGNGIKPHVDLARFEDGIVIISLLSAINMDFYKALSPMSPNDPPEGTLAKPPPKVTGQQQRKPDFTVRLEPGSILTIQGKARYEWEHGIQEIMEDLFDGETIPRKIRVSITLRKMRSSAWEVGGNSSINGIADR
ncbi:hypothetical protein FBU30_001601 [Linnemannia zychae]|nr:hypothetical protein FBU30_001601 [Linnemannia zychae]